MKLLKQITTSRGCDNLKRLWPLHSGKYGQFLVHYSRFLTSDFFNLVVSFQLKCGKVAWFWKKQLLLVNCQTSLTNESWTSLEWVSQNESPTRLEWVSSSDESPRGTRDEVSSSDESPRVTRSPQVMRDKVFSSDEGQGLLKRQGILMQGGTRSPQGTRSPLATRSPRANESQLSNKSPWTSLEWVS